MPPEGLDQAADAFSREVAPASRPRDQAGRFVQTSSKPEPMFSPRPVEGDPLTGDTRDGGDNQRFLDHERKVADGWVQDDEERRSVPDKPARARSADGDQGDDGAAETEPERLKLGEADTAAEDQGKPEPVQQDAEGQSQQDAPRYKITDLEGRPIEKFEVEVDGSPVEVTIDEALKHYVADQALANRQGAIRQAQTAIETEAARLNAAREQLSQAWAAYEDDVKAVLPPEPNWDELYKANPAQAHELQKQYQAIYGKLNQTRQARDEIARATQAEAARKSEQYAVDEFSRFVQKARIPNETELKRELDSMRRTALRSGFSEAEVASVYDSRMLEVLRKASKYDRIMAAEQPKPVSPDKGRTLSPGTASPVGASARRGFDELMSRQAKSGKIDDTAALFERMLR